MAGFSSKIAVGPSEQGKRAVALTAAVAHHRDTGASESSVLATAARFAAWIEGQVDDE